MNRRKLIDGEKLDLAYLEKMLRTLYPKNNPPGTKNEMEEVLGELTQFSIFTKLELRQLMKKHRRRIVQIDRDPIGKSHEPFLRETLGETRFRDMIRRQYWFGKPAIVRLALEIEFGEQYEKFANERDGI